MEYLLAGAEVIRRFIMCEIENESIEVFSQIIKADKTMLLCSLINFRGGS